jgi:regulator of cell morphogenesis and NO signaling
MTANKYTAKDRMRDLIEDNSALLMAISRFDISLGFGDSTVADVCHKHQVDVDTFLAVVNYISFQTLPTSPVSLTSLIVYLKHSHTYFLEFQLPSIRRKLIEAINCSDVNNVSALILKFYDNYVHEVENHMNYENKHVFSYVDGLLQNKLQDGKSITNYSAHHNGISQKLKELKDILIRHYPQRNSHLINSVLYDLIVCEQDLISHCDIEDTLFVPEVKKLEESIKKHNRTVAANAESQDTEDDKIEALSNREKDIVRLVAIGRSNKEIADELCLSVHTVTTHRRNISSKLQIHSPAGLTIFAILNNLVELDEVKHLK